MTPAADSCENKPYYLPLLLIISAASHFPFVLTGFGELDAARIGVSVIDMVKHGPEGAFINFYFSDVIPLYILYLKSFMKLTGQHFEYLPVIMNYTNAVFGTLTVIPAYILIKRLFKSPPVSFCSVLALIFAPAFYQSTTTGFPHLISFFFLLTSFCFYLTALDHDQIASSYLRMALACLFLTVSLLFKLDYILGAGTFISLLYIRKIKDRNKIISAFVIIILSGLFALIFRHLIIGPTGGVTSSSTGLSEWYNFFFPGPSSLFSLHYLERQVKPVIYAAGMITFFLGIAAFSYQLMKRNSDAIIFILLWTVLPTITWMILNGNNARHNMLSILPFLVIIVMTFFEKAPRYVLILTVMLILGNYFITSPSSSILRPSGNLIKSHALLKNRMIELHSKAGEIANIDEKQIAVLGYFSNPFTIYEILRTAPSYEAVKTGREDYKIKAGNKEYVILYIDRNASEAAIESMVGRYNLQDHVLVSVSHDLTFLQKRGLKVKNIGLIKVDL
ncbi:MAG: hypothetical protein HY758_00990 [Nitrospirae bacterium]|nr:hypothetical protein [Nitrospirota bacterium]